MRGAVEPEKTGGLRLDTALIQALMLFKLIGTRQTAAVTTWGLVHPAAWSAPPSPLPS